MSSWLRSKTDEVAPKTLRPEVEELLPASARRVDSAMFASVADDPDGAGEDKELDFLAELAGEVDREAAPATGVTPLRGANPRIDDMHVFREMKDEGEVSTRYDFRLADVDMGDLLEELTTVRAALRRKAA